MAKISTLESVHISVRGVVQGVGFRPFVYQLATKHGLKGWVCNTSEDVKIEIAGQTEAIENFLHDLREKAPPLAYIKDITTKHCRPVNYKSFKIRHSIAEKGKYQLVSPDIATCQECLGEILSPDDRRFRYPFTNCTNCGPRFTIIKDIPYDRSRTTMNSFTMCTQCQREYDELLDRRFHAQPNACPQCGPKLKLVDTRVNRVDCTDALNATGKLLKEGKIIAIKGLGGFLLACDATNQEVVSTLRQRKKRPFKPLAVMVSSLEEAKKHCHVSDDEEKLLTSPQSPIVLMKWKPDSTVSGEVAPNLKYLGVMLPYTPLHHLLLQETALPLVMTSGNLSEEPIAKDNDEAILRLAGIADFFLIHNRDIYARYDDSVTFTERGKTQLIRRARGYAPYPIHLDFKSREVLGCGAEEKNTLCLLKDDYAFLSQHIGDMENLETMEHYEDTLKLYKKLFRIEPSIIACDLHPDYLATKYAHKLASQWPELSLVPVQHHHAHIVSCMVDNKVKGPVIGVAFDGTGLGSDGNIWGGEFLVADYNNFTRTGQLEYLPLPGGAQAIRKPYRTAIGYLLTLLGENALKELPCLNEVDSLEIDVIKRQLEKGLNSPLTSSCGRLFDAVSALLGVRGKIEYEAQAAIELEMIAYDEAGQTGCYPFAIVEKNGLVQVKLGDLLAAVICDLQSRTSKAKIAARFHNSVAKIINTLCQTVSKKTGLSQVVLSGGVFQNRLLLGKTVNLLETSRLSVFTHQQVPCNDGGISLGQAVIASFNSDKE